MAVLRTKRVPLKSLNALIKPLVDCLAIGRAKMVVEQIRQTAKIGGHEQVIVMTTSDVQTSDHPLAAAVAILQPGASNGSSATGKISDMATVAHAGRLGQLDHDLERSVIEDLSAGLDSQFREHRINFVQWATDSAESNWCRPFGFEAIGTLDYLCGPVSGHSDGPFHVDSDRAIGFRKYSWGDASAFRDLVDLVQDTYVDTLDCPRLSEYRTTENVLNGYQSSHAFDPDLWFIATDSSGKEIGCAIFAAHRGDKPNDIANAPQAVAVEIVYMGLKADSRGKQYGEQLVKQAFDVARDIGANQVLLAVDRTNTPAKSIYLRAGLKPIVKETVWVKLIDRAEVCET